MEIIIVPKGELPGLIREALQATLPLLPHATATQSPRPTQPKEWLTNAEGQAFTGWSKATLQRRRDDGTLPYAKVGGSIFYRYADLVRLLEDNLVHRQEGGQG